MVLVWGIWLGSVALVIALALGFAATVPMMRRRIPDEPDHPTLHGMACEDVTFESREDHVKLGGWWMPAPGTVRGLRGTIIVCPGQNGSLDKDIPQVKPLHDAGFQVLMFDFRAHGKSDGRLVSLGVMEQFDLLGALDYVQQIHGAEQVGVMGYSMGAGVALMTAAQDERIAALVVDGAYPRLAGLLTAWGRMRGIPLIAARGLAWVMLLIGSLRARYQLYRANPADVIANVRVPTLFIHGEADPFVSNEEIQKLVDAAPGATELWLVAGAEHREAYTRNTAEYNRRITDWFERYL